MKNNNHSQEEYTKEWYDAFGEEDTRYYGLFLRGKGKDGFILIDPVRWKEIFGIPPDHVEKVMNRKKDRFFRPAKKHISDYSVNLLLGKFNEIKREWNEVQKPFINRFLSEIKGVNLTISDDDLFREGISDANESADRMRMLSRFSHDYANFIRNDLRISLYAQYFHQLASRVDAALIYITTREGIEVEKFTLDTFKIFKGANKETVEGLTGYKEFEKLRLIWNFIKHNSLSSYKDLKEKCPDILKDEEYKQGELGCFFVDINDELVDSLFIGIEKFFIEYCRLCLGEDAKEAAWNSEEHFLSVVREVINDIEDPHGLRYKLFL